MNVAATLALAALGSLTACGATVVDHTPAGNILDADTESLEGGLGHWDTWFSSAVARTSGTPCRGHASLRITVTALYGWGVGLDNWPGFPAAPGLHHLDLSARTVSGGARNLTATVRWRNEAGDDLQSDVLELRPRTTWTSGGRDLTAPPGTTRVALELTGTEGDPSDAVDVDEIYVL